MWLSDQKRAGAEAVVLGCVRGTETAAESQDAPTTAGPVKGASSLSLPRALGEKNTGSHKNSKPLAYITCGLEFELTQPTRVIIMRIDPELVITLGCLARAKVNQLRWVLPLTRPHRISRKAKSLCTWAHS